MQHIEAILFEPVGCLAEFPPEPFDQMAGRNKPSTSGSRSYWHLLNLMEHADRPWDEPLEIKVAAQANVYEDVQPALAELKEMGIKLIVASSLSTAAIEHFLQRSCLTQLFSAVWTRDIAGGIKSVLLKRALGTINPNHAMFLTDTAEGLSVASSVGVNPILMMNDPDEARRLVAHNPAGGIVSLHELPDFIRLFAPAR